MFGEIMFMYGKAIALILAAGLAVCPISTAIVKNGTVDEGEETVIIIEDNENTETDNTEDTDDSIISFDGESTETDDTDDTDDYMPPLASADTVKAAEITEVEDGDTFSDWNTGTVEKYTYVISVAEDENLTYEEKVKVLNDVRAEALEAYKNSESRELKDEWIYVLVEIDYQLHQNQFVDWHVNPLANS